MTGKLVWALLASLFATIMSLSISCSAFVAPLLEHCGGVSTGSIHDIPTTSLEKQQELALVVIVDPTRERILLRLPNDFGWRCHFGCLLPAKDDGIEESLWSQAKVRCSRVNKIGTMLFSFRGDKTEPMRVTVFQAWANQHSKQGNGGQWIDWKDCPYNEMWQDDIIWLPEIIKPMSDSQREMLCFEGHFVFDENGPGPDAMLLMHNCQFLESL